MKKIFLLALKNLAPRMSGLNASEVLSQRAQYGDNQMVEVSGNRWVEILLETLKDPMLWFLFIVGVLFFITGETQEAIILFVSSIPLLLMDIVLHWRTEASTAALKSQLASHCKVIRDEKTQLVNSRELVPGDLILLTEEDYLPADGVFEANQDEPFTVQIDESVLTGEAFPVIKDYLRENIFVRAQKTDETTLDPKYLGFAGTKVLMGKGRLRVLLTGALTAYGEIVQSVSKMPQEKTPLQKSMGKLVKNLMVAAGAFCVLLAFVRRYQGHGWLDAFLSAATLAIAAIPEEFPVVFTFFLGVGVYRLAKKHALVRRSVSVENIGRVTHICTDKTGTITRGQLELTHIDTVDSMSEAEVLQVALGASSQEGADPVDKAIFQKADLTKMVALDKLHTFPFTEDRKQATSFVLKQETLFAFIKGAPETILSKSSLTKEVQKEWMLKIDARASTGHKVLGCAKKIVTQQEVAQKQEPQAQYDFCGLLSFEDPPREGVAEAVSYCQKNGIRVTMITGDHPMTAKAIAKDIGLGLGEPVVVSAEDASDDFMDALGEADVIARCTPLQKLNIVNALKKAGNIVAVTGDGVNDVPALKAADIGIAMGQRGSKSAKEVASIVLLDDNFKTIVNAIVEGRKLTQSLKQSFEYLLLIHIPFVLTAALIPLLGYPILYLPVHVVCLELLIHPSALFAFQKNEADSDGGFFVTKDTWRMIGVGFIFTAVMLGSFMAGSDQALNFDQARTKILATLMLWSSGVVMILSRLRSWSARIIFILGIGSCLVMTQERHLSQWLHLTPLDWREGLEVICAVSVGLLTHIIWHYLNNPKK